MTFRSKFLWTFSFILLLVGSVACRSGPRVVIATKSSEEFAVQVEIADTPEKRKLGLQYRRNLGDDQGMLFLFPTEEVQSFWMINTPIPLDMIFIGSNRSVVGIIHGAVPFSKVLRSVSTPSQFVLEVRGGLSRSKGIKAGDLVRFEGISIK